MRTLLVIATLTLFSSTLMATQMYRWVDDNGVVQFGQNPPADRAYESVQQRAAPAISGQLRQPEVTPEADERQRETSQQDMAAQREREAKREAECQQLQQRLQTLQENPRLRFTNDAGELEVMGEDRRQQLIKETREDLATYCAD